MKAEVSASYWHGSLSEENYQEPLFIKKCNYFETYSFNLQFHRFSLCLSLEILGMVYLKSLGKQILVATWEHDTLFMILCTYNLER